MARTRAPACYAVPPRHHLVMPPDSPARMPWGFVAWLSVAQVISWGAIYYSFTLFIDPMMGELGWNKPALTAAFSLGLVASALAAMPVGRLIDLGYGRLVMTAGSVGAALLFAAWSRVESYPVFVAIWIGLGICLAATLYEPGFAVLTRRLGPLSRRGITAMTFLGGFASTVFIPLTHLFIAWLGWRDALLALAAFNLFVCAAIHLLVIRDEAPAKSAGAPQAANPSSARRVLPHPAFWGFVGVAVLHSALFTAITVHLIPLLTERGYSIEAAVAAFTVFGPAQVAARLVIAASERAVTMRTIGVATTALPVAAFAALWALPPGSWLIFPTVALMGAANGMMTILRAVLPAEIFGRADYGAIQGMISAPATFSKAAGPFLFAALWALWGGYGGVLGIAVGMAAASFACFVVAVLPSRK
jgi:predicted MFS family arabinose efflux permease